MTLSLYLLRHAKAQPGSISRDDFDRPLAEKGLEDAESLGDYFRAEKTTFNYAWCSSSLRTTETLKQLALGDGVETDFTRNLYHASAEKMLDVIHLTPPNVKALLVVGHNPGISQLAAMLAGADNALSRDVVIRYSPCTCSMFEFNCETWQEAGSENSQITGLWVPE